MQLHGFFFVLNFVILGLFSDFYRNFAPNRSRDTWVGEVQQKTNTPYYIVLWHRQITRFAGNALSVVQCSKYAPSILCTAPSNVLILLTRGRKTGREESILVKYQMKVAFL